METSSNLRENLPLLNSMINDVGNDSSDEVVEDKALGKKTITFFGSFVLTVNNVSGPGMLALPLVYQTAGYITPTIALIAICIVSSLASTMICEAMALVPGNKKFTERLEFATVIRHYFGQKAYILAQIFYNLSLQTLNISSILVTAQVMDELLVYVFGNSYALQVWPPAFVPAVNKGDDNVVPFVDDNLVFTLGYLICMVICMPMGFLNLDENIYFQYVSFLILVVLLVEFAVQFFLNGIETSYVPLYGEQTTVLGVVIFAYTYVVTIPSWCNEKKDNVSINKAIWVSTLTCTAAYICFGLLGAMAYSSISTGNLLSYMAVNSPPFTTFCVYIFSLGVIGLGIPLFSIIIRYNLYVGGVFGNRWSAFWGTVFPWLVSWLLYQGNGFNNFVNWASLFINGFINFVVPFVLYLKAKSTVWNKKNKFSVNKNYWEQINADEDLDDDGFVEHFSFPPFIEKRKLLLKWIPTVLAIIVSFVIVVNINTDLIYLIFLHEDVVG
eukprot:TRINITY_DN186_c0_g1_i1.p1 TRINITY_DN186_c0_g1~~TRINITY_DN186_c0_g1_i1.p1  ORF type:complete len:498 (-),score=105.27 TRINITY_DN186_c0_g1_i1:4-1497(-)